MRALAWLPLVLASFGTPAAGAPAEDIAALFPVGSGSKYALKLAGGVRGELVISIAAAGADRLAVEYYMSSTGGFDALSLWQQYVLRVPSSGPLSIAAGYIYADVLERPQELPANYIRNIGGVQVTDFLVSGRAGIDAMKVGEESLHLPAGKTRAIHFRKTTGDQTVDFWISDEAKPISLVRLESKGSRTEHNYRITLNTLVRNVAARIDPRQAIPLDDKGKALFNVELMRDLTRR